MADGDVFLASAGEFGEVGAGRLVQFDLAAFEQEQHSWGAGDDFREGCGIENRVFSHWLRRRHEGAMAVSLVIGGSAVLYPEDAAGAAFLFDGAIDGGIYFGKFFGTKRGRDQACGAGEGGEDGGGEGERMRWSEWRAVFRH